MILIGTMNLTRTKDTGQFDCPTCGVNQGYRLRSRRPFLTLYFVPCVPIGGAEMFVHCDVCRDRWDVSVLDMNRKQQRETQEDQFREEALRSAVLVTLEDGHITENEIESLAQIGHRLLGRYIDREELGQLCSVAEQNEIEARNYVLTVSKRWNQAQRSLALGVMFLAATAGGKLGNEQTAVMKQMRDILEMTQAEYEASIEAALQWESS
ncbi:MAG: TerB family tellurite resistance protein [Planctomycetota bacterium]